MLEELVVTRHNPLVDPVLRVWAWEVPIYLFLGGWVAGMMVLSGLFLLQGRHHQRRCTCGVTPWVGLALLTAGMLALFLDLEYKRHVWRIYTTFQITSPMSWGAWILLLVHPALLAAILVEPPAWLTRSLPAAARAHGHLARRPRLVRGVGLANAGLGAALGIYTGVLLASLGARPLWNSAILGPLFLLSGLSSAAAFVHLVASEVDERERLARADNLFLGLELAALGLFLAGLATATAAHRQAAALLLGGPYTAPFWVGVVGLGIALPLVIQSLAVTRRIGHTPVAPLLVLAGGLVLRIVIVMAGQESRWAAAAAGLLHRIV